MIPGPAGRGTVCPVVLSVIVTYSRLAHQEEPGLKRPGFFIFPENVAAQGIW